MLDQLSISVTKENDEVLYSSESVTKVTQKDIGILKLLAKKTQQKKFVCVLIIVRMIYFMI